MSHQQQQQQQRKKKVEWSSNLSSTEPKPTENRSPMWDTESDHLLSYFLGHNNGLSPPSGTQFTTTGSSSSINNQNMMGPSGMGMMGGARPPLHSNLSSTRPQHGFGNPASAFASATVERRQDQVGTMIDHGNDDIDEDDDNLGQPPPTPAVQHYFPSSNVAPSFSASYAKIRPRSSSSSGSILKSSSFEPSMGSHPAPQYGSYHQQMQLPPDSHHHLQTHLQAQQNHSDFLPSIVKPNPGTGTTANDGNSNSAGSAGVGSTAMDDLSPISPAAMIGGDHEPLLLPPPQSPAGARARQSHLEWLQQINAMAAKASRLNDPISGNGPVTATPMPATYGVGTTNPHNPHEPQHYTHQQQHHVHVNGGGMHGGSVVPQQQQQQQPVVAAFPPQGVALHPTAAAALAGGNPLFFTHAAAYLRQQASSSPVETEEKRAKRLERNRESARKSRRRKKERLTNLEGKVNHLHSKIDKERRLQINFMEDVLGEYEKEQTLQLKEQYTEQEGDYTRDDRLGKALSELMIDKMEPSIRKDVVEFQYASLSQHLLPRYQKFLLWLALHEESFFLLGKEEHAKREAKLALPRVSSGKISSKQVGDELTNGRKLENGKFIPPPPPPTYSEQQQQQQAENNGGGNQSAQAFDAARMWPLTCYELSISVDQEEKFLQALKRVKQYENFQRDSAQIAAATRMASGLKEAVRYQVYVSSFRKKKAYLDIMTPSQAIQYQEWMLSNRDRVNQALDERRKVASTSSVIISSPSANVDGNRTLEALCRSLEEILKISKVDSSSTS